MKKEILGIGFNLRSILVVGSLLSIHLSFAQPLSKAVEYGKNNSPIKYNYFDSNLSLLKSEFLDFRGEIMIELSYSINGDIIGVKAFKNKKTVFLYDLKSGVYRSIEDDVEIHFKNDKYDGVSKGDNLVVNYFDNKRNGEFIQTDSAIVGSKPVNIKRVDIVGLQFNFVRFYNDVINEPVYKQFNGCRLSFLNDSLNGKQKGFYQNGQIKFIADFKKNMPVRYESFDRTGNIISKIDFKNGVTTNRFIMNGRVVYGNNILLFKNLLKSGLITKGYWPGNEQHIDYKQIFNNSQDDYKEVLSFFKIPRFFIEKFEIELNDELSVVKIPLKEDCIIDSDRIDLIRFCNFNEDTLHYNVFPFSFSSESGDFLSPQEDGSGSSQINELVSTKMISELQKQYKFENRFINTPDSLNILKLLNRLGEFIKVVRKLDENQSQEINETELKKYNLNNSALSDYKEVYQLPSGNLSNPEFKPYFKVKSKAFNKEDYDRVRTISSELHDINFYNKYGQAIIKVETKFNDTGGEVVDVEIKEGKSIFKIKLIHFIRCEGGCNYIASFLLGISELINGQPVRVLKASELLGRYKIQL